MMYPMSQNRRFRVLVVDDEEEYIHLFGQILSPDGPLNEALRNEGGGTEDGDSGNSAGYHSKFDVSTCREGNAAVEMVKDSIKDNRPFSVAFLDIFMPPGPDGVSVARRIREIDPYIEIAIVTGYPDYNPSDIVARVPPIHKLVYIQKPFRVKEIYHFAHALSAKRMKEKNYVDTNRRMARTIAEQTSELTNRTSQLLREIERRARAEEALHLSEQGYRLLVEKQIDLIVKFDMEYRLLFVSSSFCITHGRERDSLLQEHYLTFIDEDERVPVSEAIQKTYKPPYSSYVEAKTTTRHGLRWYAWLFNSVLDQDGVVVATLAVGRDITELKMAELGLKESKRKLQVLYSHLIMAQEEERKRIASDLHDDLGQTLAVLKIRIQSIQKRLPRDKQGLYGECEDTLLYINGVIDHVRRLSHDLSPAALDDLGLTEALRALSAEFTRHAGIKIVLRLENIDNLFPSTSAVLLYRVFQEALTNIEKHSRAKQVVIEAKMLWNQVHFLIKDDGVGFDSGALELKTVYEGGLGFSSMKERIHMLGGELNVKSRPGKGTAISFAIPVVAH